MDYYAILEIKYGATAEEIKKAFHRLAHIHHPDKGGDVKKFQEINNAYQELCKNPQYRRVPFNPNASRAETAAAANQSFNESMQDFVNRANAMKNQDRQTKAQYGGFNIFTMHFSNGGMAFDGTGKAYKLVKNQITGNYEWLPMQ